MNQADIIEIKAFIPAWDFSVSLAFYADLGFEIRSKGGGVAYLSCDSCSFLLQEFFVESHAHNFQMHILVKNVGAWYAKVCEAKLVEKYQVRMTPIKTQPYVMRDFTVSDPSGVCWIIGENIPGGLHV
jgi:hypothetical protein